ncbi:MAG: NfeD family protein [Oscillospiraceae bacterium]|nr:NfeD family protein [Oscillospiraceae bacterium]
MEWFSVWWNGLQLAEQILYCIAVPATLILIIQIILMLIGLGDSGGGINPSDTSGLDLDGTDGLDMDTDVSDLSDHDISSPTDIADFRLLSVQSVIAFLCIFGWSGIAALSCGAAAWLAIAIGAVLGFGAMLLVAKIIQWSSKLAQNGNFNVKNLLGESGTVYIPIPPKGEGTGKINISCGERFLEFDAVTEEEKALATGSAVRVVDIISGSTLVVEKIS